MKKNSENKEEQEEQSPAITGKQQKGSAEADFVKQLDKSSSKIGKDENQMRPSKKPSLSKKYHRKRRWRKISQRWIWLDQLGKWR